MHIEIGTAVHGDATKWIFAALNISPQSWACIQTPFSANHVIVTMPTSDGQILTQEIELPLEAIKALNCWTKVHDILSFETLRNTYDRCVISYGDGVRYLFIEIDDASPFADNGPYRQSEVLMSKRPYFHLAKCESKQYAFVEVFSGEGVDVDSALFYELFRSHPNVRLLRESLVYERVGVSSVGYSTSSRVELREREEIFSSHQIQLSPFSLDSLALALQQAIMSRGRVRLLTLERIRSLFQLTQPTSTVLVKQHRSCVTLCIPKLAEMV